MAAGRQIGGGKGSGGGMRGGGSSGKSGTSKNVVSISTKKALTPAEIKQRAARSKNMAAGAKKVPADRMQYGPVQKWGMKDAKPAPKAPTKRTLASDAKKVAKSPKTKVAGAVVGTGALVKKVRANDKAQQQKMITIKNQWEKSAAKKAGMTLNDYIKKYGK